MSCIAKLKDNYSYQLLCFVPSMSFMIIKKPVLYPPQVIPCGIHGMGGGFHGMGDGFHTFGGWIPWNGGWIPYFFHGMGDGLHTF